MSQPYAIQDLAARKRALDVTINAVVSAGAGSGKTSILTQRHLACLLTVDRPEQVLSMTFTRDAASEMRHRIISALREAEMKPRPESEYEQISYDLAKKVLKRDKELGWFITQNPHRLAILTIDSLCAQIVKQVPVLSGLGGEVNIVDDPFSLYIRAATNVIASINDTESGLEDDVRALLLHLNGNQQRCVDLIASMLAKRDQWMRHVSAADSVLDKDKMSAALKSIIRTQTDKAEASLGTLRFAIADLLDFAQLNLTPDSPVYGGSEEEGFWARAAHLFLTNDNKLRKSVTKTLGFPAGKDTKERKAAWLDVADQMTEEQVALLAKFKKIPTDSEGGQWDLLDNLFRLLWQAAIELKMLFIQTGQVDFTEVAQRALVVLRHDGEVEREIQFKIFNSYKHILVDEVQDTNRTQYEIIEALVSEWDPSMNNSLFLVGDPKQSIYRFREADVGLFMQSKIYGVGDIMFESLDLTSNFRSSDDIVNWNNDIYQNVFPSQADIAMGAVPYSKSTPVKHGAIEEAVTVIPLLEKSESKEAEAVLDAVKEQLAANPEGDIAVLVRARSHLTEIARTLFEHKIPYHAIEIEQLSTRQVILDALSITKAILHAFDNSAWVSLFRMPCIGLSLQDITTLCESIGNDAIIERLRDSERIASLTNEGRDVINRLNVIMDWARERIGTVTIRQLVEGIWLQLGAPAGYSDRDIRDVQTFFGLLDEYGFAITIDINLLLRRLDKLYAQPKFNAATKVTLMTLHKSKGLEFDTVIMPGLGNSSRSTESSLVMWHEFTAADSQDAELLVAPIRSVTADPNYAFLMDMESEKDMYERMRLMYVGTTRPKKKLYLIGHIDQKDVEGVDSEVDLKAPPKSAMLSIVWDAVSPKFLEAAKAQDASESTDEEDTENKVAGYGTHYFRKVKRAHVPTLRPDTHITN